ncbi:hypothetical protein [Pectinatus sottacetonis]|uniref:hypothetical protein n=1 Tax=Pectinatus sottacetonis TaxID=1002795 RepID=UPI0018C50F4E|nr:hypothetical protein [Pectinatus sottacetonis]
MILIDIYKKLDSTIISKKLGVGICNLDSDGIEEVLEMFEEEIIINKYKIDGLKNKKNDIEKNDGWNDLDSMIKKFHWGEFGKYNKQIIAEHLVEIDVLNFNNSMLKLKNSYMGSPTCEIQYAKKFIILCQILSSSTFLSNVMRKKYMPDIIYDSREYNCRRQILSKLKWYMLKGSFSINQYNDSSIKTLKQMGKMIDEFLVSTQKFWLFDYITNVISDLEQWSAYHIFKVMSLIEMLIIKSNNKGKTHGELERKLPFFLPHTIERTKKNYFTEIMRRLRNKIAHGDYKAVTILLKQYKEEFMQEVWYDEFEYSIENWIYGNICANLDETLSNILYFMVSNRVEWEKFRNNV